MSRYIVLGVFLVFLLIPLNQAFAQQFDPLEKLINSTILVDGRTLLFSHSDIEIRQFANSHIIKIQGQATTGEILIVFLKDNNANFHNVMVVSDGHFLKGSLIPKSSAIETKVEVETEEGTTQYIPSLALTSSNNFRTYWNDNFNVNVQVFDTNINRDPKNYEFEGRVDDVDITVIISLHDEVITTLKGITENGDWSGQHYFNQLSLPGKYTIDILATLGDQTISKPSSMFLIAYFSSGSVGGGNHTPVADAGPDQTLNHPNVVTLDGSASSDSDGDTLTFSWVQTSGLTVTLDDNTAEKPTFSTLNAGDTYVFQLTVTDPKGANSTDTVTITVNP